MPSSKRDNRRILRGPALAVMTALVATGAFAQSTSDIVFIVDESGSMAGEQAFLRDFVPTLDRNLGTAGINARYGLVGFGEGGANDPGVIYNVGGMQFGTAAQFSTSVTANLDTSGATEDGYTAIDVAAQGYTFDPNSSVVLVLVTDEDRDNTNNALTAATIQTQLAGINGGATLIGIVDADITGSGGQAGIGTNGTEAFLVDMAGNVTQVPLGSVTSNAGTTEADYITPALASSSGCVADLNQLRAGGDAATGFASVFNLCLARAASSGGATTLSQPLLSVIRDLGMSFARVHSRAGNMRMDGLGGGGAHRGAGYTPGRGEVVLDAYGIEGLRMFVDFRATNGNSDPNGNNVGFDYDGYSISAGIDRSFDLGQGGALGSALIGLAGTVGDHTADVDGVGNVSLKGYGLKLHGGVESNSGFYGDAHAGYSILDIDTNRISGANAFSGDTDGTLLTAGIRVGYDFPPRLQNPIRGRKVTFGPYASLDYANLDIDGFSASNNGLIVNDFDSERLDGEIGLRGQLAFEANGGTLFINGRAGYRYDFLDDDQNVGIATRGGATGTQRIDSSNDGAIALGLELGGSVTQDLTIAFGYDGLYGDDLTEHGVEARIRFSF